MINLIIAITSSTRQFKDDNRQQVRKVKGKVKPPLKSFLEVLNEEVKKNEQLLAINSQHDY